MSPVRLVIVDDSPFVRKALVRVLQHERRIRVVGAAASGEELLANIHGWRPDIITLDLSMPGMGGLSTLDAVMRMRPIPVIIMSTQSGRGAPLTLDALERGAADFVDKQHLSLVDFDAVRRVLVQKILTLTGSRTLVERASGEHSPSDSPPATSAEPYPSVEQLSQPLDALLIGASTGGPPAIEKILSSLDPGLPVPVAVVQHMPSGFTRAFADRLNAHLPLSIKEAAHGDPFLPGHVYIAPADTHLRIRRTGHSITLGLSKYPESSLHKPSVDVLFNSAAEAYGERALAVLLTGMGRDGAEGMVSLCKAGAYTVAQDESSCVVFGMPKAAIDLGAVRRILPLHAIGPFISGCFPLVPASEPRPSPSRAV